MLNDFTAKREEKIAIVFGNEVKGVEQEVINNSKGIIEIPQLGTKHSLNISVSVGIVVWDLFSSSDNCVRRINDTFSLFPTNELHQRLANSSGYLITITEDGNITPILTESEIVKLLNPVNNNTRNVIQLNNSSSSSTTVTTITNYHSVYNPYHK